jgi:hypothetical protein
LNSFSFCFTAQNTSKPQFEFLKNQELYEKFTSNKNHKLVEKILSKSKAPVNLDLLIASSTSKDKKGESKIQSGLLNREILASFCWV